MLLTAKTSKVIVPASSITFNMSLLRFPTILISSFILSFNLITPLL
nr:MAG TPA: hypothetical protein [Caudoviricetes sp.]